MLFYTQKFPLTKNKGLLKKSILISSSTKHLLAMENSEIIESYTASLVREYLHRKGFKITLSTLDMEFPRDSMSINRSSTLIRGLRMENSITRNKRSKKPYRSILEVIVHHVKIHRNIIGNRRSAVKYHKAPTLLTLSHLKCLQDGLNEKGYNVDFLTLIKIYSNCWPFGLLNNSSFKKRNNNTTRRSDYLLAESKNNFIDPVQVDRMVICSDGYQEWLGKQNGIKRDENGEPSYDFDDKFYYAQREPQIYPEKETSTLTEKENVLKSYLLGKNSPTETSCNGREESLEKIQDAPEAVKDACSILSASSKRTLNSNRSTSPSPTKQSLKNFVHLNINNKSQFKTEEVSSPINVPSITFSDQDSKTSNSSHFLNSGLNIDSKQAKQVEEVRFIQEVEHAKDAFIPNAESKLEQQLSNSCHVKKMLLANNKIISKKWLGESFIFAESPVSYGLIQTKEGPGGLIAAINAYVIKQLLFDGPKKDVEYLRPNKSELETALIMAMTDVLWQAGGNSATVTILDNPSKEFNTIEEIIDNSINKIATSKNDLQETIKRNILQYTQPNGHGSILFLISTILSRGVENVLDDMNGAASLISSNGYSSLELVNLLITGHAVSNVFDNNIKLKYSTIKGIARRSDIGYLSIKEHFKCCKVGSYLKTPRYPIWLVHNENDFATIFSCQKQLVSDWKVERKFLLFFHDSHRNEEIRLVIDTTQAEERRNDLGDIKASLEHCVRTKWKDANITWK